MSAACSTALGSKFTSLELFKLFVEKERFSVHDVTSVFYVTSLFIGDKPIRKTFQKKTPFSSRIFYAHVALDKTLNKLQNN